MSLYLGPGQQTRSATRRPRRGHYGPGRDIGAPQRTNRQGSARAGWDLGSLYGQAPQLDTQGLYGQAAYDIDRGTSKRQFSLQRNMRRTLGPRVNSVLEAAAPARFVADATRQKLQARQGLNLAAGQFDQRNFVAALQGASQERGRITTKGIAKLQRDLQMEIAKMNQPGFMDFLGNLFGAAGMVGAGAMGRA